MMMSGLDFLNDPAYRMARYNYVWGKDDNAIANYWKEYNTREDKRIADEAAREDKRIADEALRQEKLKLEKEQAEDRYNTNIENYWTAKTKFDNTQIEYDRLVKEKGKDSPEAMTANNELINAAKLVNSYASKIGLAGVDVSALTSAPAKSQSPTPKPAAKPAAKPEMSTEAIKNQADEVSRQFNRLKDKAFSNAKKVSMLATLDNLYNEPNAESVKDYINQLIVKIRDTRTKEDRGSLSYQINEALKDLDNRKNREFLEKNGYTIERKNGKRKAIKKEG